jgi:hypothetical protein
MFDKEKTQKAAIDTLPQLQRLTTLVLKDFGKTEVSSFC